MDVEKNEKDLAGDISADEKDDGLPNETVFKLAPEEALILQKALNDAGHLCQRSGVVGKKTVRALKRYQRSKGLPVTGKPDKETLKSLNIYDEIAKRENK
jgi:peptidoglycan hydrolase-like protein with peptidoglycan-binding domain